MATFDLAERIVSSRINPRALTRLALQYLNERSSGELGLVEASNPVALVTEMASSISAGTILAVENATRPLYKSATLKMVDLYRHMADKDFLDRFSSPATGTFVLLLDLDEVTSRAVLVPNANGVRKLVIPRFTSVVVEDHWFCTQYPIEIRVLPQDNISVVYDVSVDSPFDILKSNRLSWNIHYVAGKKKLAVTIDMKQLRLSTNYVNLNSLAGYRKEFSFTDYFYYARVYTRASDAIDWVEIKTTHVDDVYDPYNATACLRVQNGILVVNIPQIYFANGLIKEDVRVDIYSTKGPINLNLSNLTAEDFRVKLMESVEPLDLYSTPLQTMRSFKIVSPYKIQGGTKGLTFVQMRDRVINRTGNAMGMPITELQLKESAAVLGFDVVKYIDNVTNRVFVATRDQPAPTNGDLVNGMDMTVLPWLTRLEEEIDGKGIVRVGDRVVIKPNVLFEETSSGLKRIDQMDVDLLDDRSVYTPSDLANRINTANYLFTPFHYVVDTSYDRMRLSAFDMTHPEVEGVDFVDENLSLGINTSTTGSIVGVKPDGTGYRVGVVMATDGLPTALRAGDVAAQLSYTDSHGRHYIQGELKGPFDPSTQKPLDGQWLFVFDIPTRFDVDEDDRMSFGTESSSLPLNTEFDLIYVIKDYVPNTTINSAIDALVETSSLSNYEQGSLYYGLSHEKLYVRFGRRLSRLWTRMRTIGGVQEYLRYPVDIPMLYESDVYETDATGLPIIDYDEVSGAVSLRKLHSQGDPVFDSAGDPVYKHRAGDFVLDNNQQPIPDGGVIGQLREIDMFLLDACYRYADDVGTSSYYEDCLTRVVQWIDNDLEDLSGRLIDQTKLYFHPKKNFGQVKVITGVGDPETIRSEQRLTLTFDVSQSVYDNPSLKQSLCDRAGRVIDAVLKQTVISKTDVEIALKEAFSTDILSARITGLFEDKHYVVTVIDKSVRPVVGKRLVVTGTQSLRVINDIDYVFVPHRV